MNSSWDHHKDVLRTLYLSKDRKIRTLRSIMAHMASKHDFVKTKGQYERQFHKWGFRKNSTSVDWKIVHGKIEKRQKQGKSSVVYRSGRHIQVEKLNKEKRHYFRKAEELYRIEAPPPPPTPEGFTVCTPVGDNALPVLINNFPSLQLFSRLESLVTHAFPNVDIQLQGVYGDLVSGHWNASSDAFCELFQVSRTGGLSQLILPMLHLASNNLLSEEQASDVMGSLLQSGSRSLFNALISTQSPVTKAIARSLLPSAIESLDLPMVKSLLDTGISPDTYTTYWQERPLQLAARAGCTAVTSLLLHYGAHVNLPCFKGSFLPLTIAARSCAPDLVQLLLTAGADVNAPSGSDGNEMTALQAAASTIVDQSETIQLLLDAEANINAPAGGTYGETALQAAVRHGHIALVQILLSNGADVDAPATRFKGTALETAASAGDLGLIQLLLEWGASDALGAMEYASKQGHVQVVQALLRFGQTHDVLSNGAYERMALKAGARCGDYHLVRHLLETHTEVDTPAVENDTEWTTALQVAAREGREDIAELLITFGADVNAPARGDGGLTALQGAARQGNVDIVKLLLRAGANVNAPSSRFGMVALESAFKSESLEIPKLLLASGANLEERSLQYALDSRNSRENVQLCLDHNIEHDNILFQVSAGDATRETNNELILLLLNYNALDKTRTLWDAVCESNLKLVELLLHHGADVNDNPTCNGNDNVLETAAFFGDLSIMNLLIGHGANARQRARALQAAAHENEIEAARLLLSFKADVNAAPLSDLYNDETPRRTALQAAAGNGNFEMVRLLLEAGADVESKVRHEDEEGTALQFAAMAGSISIASEMIHHGADVNAPAIGRHGRTALEGAAEHGRLDMVQLLLNVEAEARGSRAVRFARNEGHDGVVQFLLENGFEDLRMDESA